jgi:hypothetical protein
MSQEEIYKAAGELLDKVIVKTQVVDSTLTRSQAMRGKGLYGKIATAFRSEPTVSYNLWLESAMDISADMRRGKSAKEALAKNGKALKTVLAANVVTSFAAALIESFFAAWREDEEDKEFLESVLETLPGKMLENILSPLQMGLVKDLVNIVFDTVKGGFHSSSDRMEYAAIEGLAGAIQKLVKVIDEGGATFETIYNLLEDVLAAGSQISGIPVANAVREIENAWNNTIGAITGLQIDMKETSRADAIERAIKNDSIGETVEEMISEKLEKLHKEKPKESTEELRKEAKTSVKSSLTMYFKKFYLEAIEDEDYEEMSNIKTYLSETRLYENVSEKVSDWERAYKEEQN